MTSLKSEVLIDNSQATTKGADFVFLGLPYYGTCGVKPTLAYNSFVHSFNSLSSFDLITKKDFFDNHAVACLKPIRDYAIMEKRIKELNEGKNFIFIGGEHLVTLPIVKALKPKRVLIFDAHADFFNEYKGKKESYATVTRRVSELVDEVYLLGVRDLTLTEHKDLKKSNVKLISVNELKKLPKGEMYVSIDLDLLNPSECPDVSTPVPLGWSMKDLVNALKITCLRFNIKALDLTELTCNNPCLSSVNSAGIIMNYLWMRR